MRVLFAEDDRQLRESVARGLREASYVVDLAPDGTQALALAREHRYDVVILDILMAGMTGLDVCRAIRAAENSVPVLMLTALDAVEQRITGLDAGADDYLTKPFDFGELLARLRALTRRRGDVLSPELIIGDLVIDTTRHQVRRGAREIPLTTKEFTFLHHLARHAGRVVSRAELMEHVWEDKSNTYSNIIDVYASRLRRKLEEGDETPLVATLRGTGFMLNVPPGHPSARADADGERADAGRTRG
ncbi:MAG TPA: response regulator transcription factor [Gemmatimonadaceae bacterium]|nr:response regulator transcription factor [Gemmatimonadota bacterium]HNV73416.1 response regulator transcription factor [Gemmatimonadaceae bacterium]MBK6842774.1 response regulator transcription factor [Gemmatimonadota bacterium]MBK8059391.1 response regulator transcription factor [Gemmatimonadota bacterium]MBK9976324.1 response regulator transcription factor [Gemmatimonadota bacterium]